MEGETQTIRLEDVDSSIFGLLVHRLYHQKVLGVTGCPEPFAGPGSPLLAYALGTR